jgi:hypothetical protein
VLGQRSIRAIGFPARDLAVIPLTDEEPPLTIECHPIGATALLSDDLGPTAGYQSVDQIRAYIHKQPMAIRMPHRTFGKDKPGRETLSLRGFHDIGELGRHHILLVLIRVKLYLVQQSTMEVAAKPHTWVIRVTEGYVCAV